MSTFAAPFAAWMHQLANTIPAAQLSSISMMQSTNPLVFARFTVMATGAFLYIHSSITRTIIFEGSQRHALGFVPCHLVAVLVFHTLPPFLIVQHARFTRRRSLSESLMIVPMSAALVTPLALHTAAMSSSFTTCSFTNFLPMRL